MESRRTPAPPPMKMELPRPLSTVASPILQEATAVEQPVVINAPPPALTAFQLQTIRCTRRALNALNTFTVVEHQYQQQQLRDQEISVLTQRLLRSTLPLPTSVASARCPLLPSSPTACIRSPSDASGLSTAAPSSRPAGPRRHIGATEWNSLFRLTDFNESELDRLHAVFCARQSKSLLTQRSFWQIISEMYGFKLPVKSNMKQHILTDLRYLRFYLHDNSLLAARMFSIFDVLKLGLLTFLEFSLAIAIICGRSTFLDRATFAFDVFDLHQDQRLSTEELYMCAETVDLVRAFALQKQRASGSPKLPPQDVFEVQVSDAVQQLYMRAMGVPDLDAQRSITKDEFKRLVVSFPQILDPFTCTFEQFCVNVGLDPPNDEC